MADDGESWVRGDWWNKKFITPRTPASSYAASSRKRSQSSPPRTHAAENVERNPNPVELIAEPATDVFAAAPSTPTKPSSNAVPPTPTAARVYSPSIRGTPGGAARTLGPPFILRSLLWPNVPAGRLLGLQAANTWERLRREHNVETTAADHAAARAHQDQFCIEDGQDDRRNAGGFDPQSYETNDERRKRYCGLAYADLRRAAIALDRITDSQTWVISFRPEAHPDNVEAVSGDPTVQRVRNPLMLGIPLFHVPAALQYRGATLPEWRAEVQGLKNHIRRVFAAPHVETYPARRKAAGLSGTLSGAVGLQLGDAELVVEPRLPDRLRRLGLDEQATEQIQQILDRMPIQEAFAVLIIVHQLSARDAIDLVQAKLDDEDDGI